MNPSSCPSPAVIDLHNDTLVSLIRRGHLSLAGGGRECPEAEEGTVRFLRGPLETEAYAWNGQLDLASARTGGVAAAFFAVDVTRARGNHLAYALDAIGYFLADAAALGGQVRLIRSGADLDTALSGKGLGTLLVLENSEALEGSLNVLHALHALGVRSITLTHNLNTWAAAGNAEAAGGGGLTRFGRALVREMNRLRMLVDVSHIAPRGFWETLETASAPVVASHSCCATLCPHPRNLEDDQLRALRDSGGLVGITFVPSFLDPGWRQEDFPTVPGPEWVVRHIEHAVEIAGIDHVAIGSDFDGGGTALASAAEYPRIAEALREKGWGEEPIRKVFNGNAARVIREVLGA